MKSNKKKIFSDSIFLTISSVVLKLKGLIFLPIIIPIIGMKRYGAFVQILLNPKMISPFCSLALGMGFYRFSSKLSDNDIDGLSNAFWSVFWISLILSIFGGIILFLASSIISEYILEGIGKDAIRISSIYVITGTLWTQLTKYLQSRKHFKLFSIFNFFYVLIPYLGLVFGVIVYNTLFMGFFLYVIFSFIILSILFIYIVRKLKFKWISFIIIKDYLVYSWPLIFSNFSGGILDKIDRYFIGYFLGPLYIGYYNIIKSAVKFLDTITIPFRKYFGIYLPKMWDNGKNEKVKKQIKDGMVIYLMIVFFLLALLVNYLNPVVEIILNKNLNKIQNYKILILILGLSTIFWSISRLYNELIRLHKKNHFQLVTQAVASVINILLNYILIMKFGIIGAGIATIISFFIIILVKHYYFRINYDNIFAFNIIRIVIISISTIIIYNLIPPSSIIKLFLSVFFTIIFYILTILISDIITKNKYSIIKKYII